jgi:TetR/AcrR family transcriptional regulator
LQAGGDCLTSDLGQIGGPDIAMSTLAPPAAGQPRRYSTAQILRAAESVFARHGIGGATMAAIAEAAHLPKANLHYYFGSKDALYQAVLEDILSTWLADADVWIVPERTARDGLEGYIRAKMEWTRLRADASRIFAGEMLAGGAHIRDFLANELRAHVARMETVFAHWTRTGSMRPVSPQHLLFCIWAMTQSYADFTPQMEAVLDRPHGLDDRDYRSGCETILSMVLCMTHPAAADA